MGVRLSIAAAGAVAVWAFLVNRVVIQRMDGPFKVGMMLALGTGLASLGWISARTTLGGSRLALWIWPVVLATFGVGEAHRAWLRSTYGATSTNVSLWDPVTTTDLELRRFTLELAPLGACASSRSRTCTCSTARIPNSSSASTPRSASSIPISSS